MSTEDEMPRAEAVREIADLARMSKPIEIALSETPDGVSFPVAIVSKANGEYEVLDLHAEARLWRDAPERREGTAEAFTLESFISLVDRHKDIGSAVFANVLTDQPSLMAVIDYHTVDHKPRFGEHRVRYDFPISPEWKAWKAKNGGGMSQGEFAQWIEDHIAEIAAPLDAERSHLEHLFQTSFAASGSSLITFSRGLKINVESKGASFANLQTGEVQLSYEEYHKDSENKPIKVPGLIVVKIPLFMGGDEVRLIARLRYRYEGGKVTWFFLFYRWEEAFRNSVLVDVDRVARETGLPVYEGSPED